MIALRRADTSDGKALADIYRYYVENTAITFEYNAPDSEEFAERIAHKTEKYPFIVATENGRPIGYAYASQYRERAAYSWDVETSVYVSADRLGKGVGRRLYSALEEILRLQNVVNLYACITHPNPQSVSMHEAMGYKYAGRLHFAGFKFGEWHDVTWFEKQISFPDKPHPIIPYRLLDTDTVDSILKNC